MRRISVLRFGKLARVCYYLGLGYFVFNCLITATLESESVGKNDNFNNKNTFAKSTLLLGNNTANGRSFSGRFFPAISRELGAGAEVVAHIGHTNRHNGGENSYYTSAQQGDNYPPRNVIPQQTNSYILKNNIPIHPTLKNDIKAKPETMSRVKAVKNPRPFSTIIQNVLMKKTGYSGLVPSAELQHGMSNMGSSLLQLFDAMGTVLSLSRHLTFKNVMTFLSKSKLSFTEWFYIVFIPSAIIAVIIEFVNPVLFLAAVSLGIFGHAMVGFLDADLAKPQVGYKTQGEGQYQAVPYAGQQVVYAPVQVPVQVPMVMYPNPLQFPAQRLASLAAAYAQAYGQQLAEATSTAPTATFAGF